MSCSIEASQTPTVDSSGQSEAVYVILENVDDGRARLITGQKSYMQLNAVTPTRPKGHMTMHLQYSHSLAWDPPLSNIDQLQEFKLPTPAKFDWWRSTLSDPSCKLSGLMKRRTLSLGAGIANSGDLITFQNSPKDV